MTHLCYPGVHHLTCQLLASSPCSNFITDKPSSRVLAPPGGGSSIVFG